MVFSSCFKLFPDGDGPTDVHWKGRVLDAVSDRPLAGQKVDLRNPHHLRDIWANPIIRGDILQSYVTDSLGRFEFRYYDPDDKGWFTAETSHPDYFPGIAGGNILTPTDKDLRLDIRMKPKAWLKIRVHDVPEKNPGSPIKGVTFRGIYQSKAYTYTTYILPSMGDTTFVAYIQGGETVSFDYKDDSTGFKTYEAIFPPHDTTELTFTY